MPHIVLKGPVTPEDIWLAFQPLEIHESGAHYKVTECYLKDDKKELLLRSLVVERDFPKNFFIRIAHRDEQLTINLEPLAGPERTDAVKRLIGLCAQQIIIAEPETQVVKTNIQEFIKTPDKG